MKIKQWINYSFSLSIIIIAIVFFVMKWSDTYSNTHYNRTQFYSEPNKNVLKVNYIINNPTKYDSFIFGSSRIENINPLNIQGGNYYNMTYSEGIPKEHLLNIKLFLKENVHIKNLLIGLDEFSYQVPFEKHQHQGLTKAHYLATKTNLLTYYKELYLRFPLSEDRHYIKKKIFNSKNLNSLNVAQQEKKYKYILKQFNMKDYTTKAHLNNKKFNKPTYYNGNTITQTLSDIRAIKDICIHNNIKCTFFINPIYHKTYQYTNKELLKDFKYKLSEITSYYNFSLQTELSHNNKFWKDTSHYNLIVGDMILNRIHKNRTNFEDFGIYIKKRK